MPRKQKLKIRGPKPCLKHKKLGEYIPDCVACQWVNREPEPPTDAEVRIFHGKANPPGFPIVKVDPYDFRRLYGDEKYNLNGMLLTAYHIPAVIYPSVDKHAEFWSDRSIEEWQAVHPLIKTQDSGDAYYAGATDESLLAFASKMAGFTATGAMITRYTNAGGYPTLHLVVVQVLHNPSKRSVYNLHGPHVNEPKPDRIDMFGRLYHHSDREYDLTPGEIL